MIRHYKPVVSYLIIFSVSLLTACASTHQAPVIERAASTKQSTSGKPLAKNTAKDWRPDSHTVKKGDTLYSIGLQYGYDYKEIAQANNIAAPYTIHVGQQLKIKELSTVKPAETNAVTPANDNSVVVTPLKTDSNSTSGSGTSATVTSSVVSEPPVLNQPKAIREPYSEQAMIIKAPPAAKPVITSQVKPVETAKPENTKPDNAKPETSKPEGQKTDTGDDEAIDWAWPTVGKVITTFNDSSNAKGIDISGNSGQAVNATAAGKVIYSGSDLRGYGKLVIIKHNKTYLSVYAHNSQILVKEGQVVTKGQKIAEMGDTDADRVKLHFEIRQQGKSVDPGKYLSSN
ncbi:MAG TPA: peptidoglycan DD-metalloendopeptidase family protein [Methylophilaceae bacterium]|nr:peptidoglycan DD-metalloendopeptidase family protein [Methylophilaceae bacterium]